MIFPIPPCVADMRVGHVTGAIPKSGLTPLQQAMNMVHTSSVKVRSFALLRMTRWTWVSFRHLGQDDEVENTNDHVPNVGVGMDDLSNPTRVQRTRNFRLKKRLPPSASLRSQRQEKRRLLAIPSAIPIRDANTTTCTPVNLNIPIGDAIHRLES